MLMAGARAAIRNTVAPLVGPAVIPRRAADGQAALRVPIDEGYRLRIVLSLLFAYAELRDVDLGRYVSFLEAPVEQGPAATVSAKGPPRAR